MQLALTHPQVKRVIPGSTGIGYGSEADLIAANLANGNLRLNGGGKLWIVTRRGRRTSYTPYAIITADGRKDEA
jgi:hypothetical protein